MLKRFPEFKLMPRHEQLLRDTTIDEDGPGSILRDFESLLSYIGEQTVQITRTYNLRLRYLRELNACFTNPLELGLTRSTAKIIPSHSWIVSAGAQFWTDLS